MGYDARLDGGGEREAIHGEGAAARHARLIGRLEHNAPKLPHLGLEEAVRVRGLERFEAVTADQLGETVGLMRGGHSVGAHLVQRDADAALRQRPGGLASREPAPDDARPYDASGSTWTTSSTGTSCAHLRHRCVSPPVALDLSSSIPTNPQLGQGTATGLFQVE